MTPHYEPFDELFATIAKIVAAQGDDFGEDAEASFDELLPMVEKFLTVEGFARDLGGDVATITTWLLLYQRRWLLRGEPGRPLTGADDPLLNSAHNCEAELEEQWQADQWAREQRERMDRAAAKTS